MITLPTTLHVPATILRVDEDPAFIFAQLVQFARSHEMPSSYLSDLYHDALWLERHQTDLLKDGYFYYGIRYHGTSIGQEWRFIAPYNWHVALCVLPTVDADSIAFVEALSRSNNRPRVGRELMTRG